MRLIIGFAAAALSLHAAAMASPSVSEEFGNIIFHNGQGVSRLLTSDHHSGKPVLSPDGRTLAWIHVDRKAGEDPNEAGQTSVWIADALTGGARKLAGSTHDADLQAEIVNPRPSLFRSTAATSTSLASLERRAPASTRSSSG